MAPTIPQLKACLGVDSSGFDRGMRCSSNAGHVDLALTGNTVTPLAANADRLRLNSRDRFRSFPAGDKIRETTRRCDSWRIQFQPEATCLPERIAAGTAAIRSTWARSTACPRVRNAATPSGTRSAAAIAWTTPTQTDSPVATFPDWGCTAPTCRTGRTPAVRSRGNK